MGTFIIAGSRTISHGWIGGRYYKEIAEHNQNLLHTVILKSGFHTTVINLHNSRGVPNVYVGRGRSVWGNPFTHLKSETMAKWVVGTREESIERYKDWFMEQPELCDRISELRGKVLGCWCVQPNGKTRCHAEWLAEITGRITGVVSGGASGVDLLGEDWAKRNGIEPLRMAADWDRYGKRAGMLRNRQMAEREEVEGAIVLNAGTPGSTMMIEEMKRAGKPCYTAGVEVREHRGYLIH